MFRLPECDNCNAKGEPVYHVLVLAGGERLTYCLTCHSAAERLAGQHVVSSAEWRYDPAADGYAFAHGETGGRAVFRPGDSFLMNVRGADGYMPARVLVGRPGERGVIAAATGLDDCPVLLMSPEEAQAIQDRLRGGGSAEDDAP